MHPKPSWGRDSRRVTQRANCTSTPRPTTSSPQRQPNHRRARSSRYRHTVVRVVRDGDCVRVAARAPCGILPARLFASSPRRRSSRRRVGRRPEGGEASKPKSKLDPDNFVEVALSPRTSCARSTRRTPRNPLATASSAARTWCRAPARRPAALCPSARTTSRSCDTRRSTPRRSKRGSTHPASLPRRSGSPRSSNSPRRNARTPPRCATSWRRTRSACEDTRSRLPDCTSRGCSRTARGCIPTR